MAVIIEDALAKRLANRSLFVANDICIGAFTAYKLSSSLMKVQLMTGYRGIISGLNVLPCLVGEIFSFVGSTDPVLPQGPCPGFAGPVLAVDAMNHSFDVGFDMGSSTIWTGIGGAFSFHSPVALGIFGMFNYAHVEIYTGDVPLATDDLSLLTPACTLVPVTFEGSFDQANLNSYARMVYNGEQNSLSASYLLYGTAAVSGTPTWIRISAYCRERTAYNAITVKRYSLIVPIEGNEGVSLDPAELVESEFVTALSLTLAF